MPTSGLTSQDTFNKIVTLTMLVFFMVMYTLSFALNRHLDVTDVLAFLVPVVTHTTHLAYNAVTQGGDNVKH